METRSLHKMYEVPVHPQTGEKRSSTPCQQQQGQASSSIRCTLPRMLNIMYGFSISMEVETGSSRNTADFSEPNWFRCFASHEGVTSWWRVRRGRWEDAGNNTR